MGNRSHSHWICFTAVRPSFTLSLLQINFKRENIKSFKLITNKAVAILGILSRVFLFHFEKISGHFGLFRVFRDVSVKTGRNSRFDQHKICAQKKLFLKPKQICIIYTEKSRKEKKKKWTKILE